MSKTRCIGPTPDEVIATLQREPYKNPEWWQEDSRLEKLINRPLSEDEKLSLKIVLYGQLAYIPRSYKLGHMIEMWERFVQSLSVTDIDEATKYSYPLFRRSTLETLAEQLPACPLLDPVDGSQHGLNKELPVPSLKGHAAPLG